MEKSLRTYSKEQLITEAFLIKEEYESLKTKLLTEVDLLDLIEKHYNQLISLIEEKEKQEDNGNTE